MTDYKEMHVECPDCGSSDGLTVYADGGGFCFAQCNADGKGYKPAAKAEAIEAVKTKDTPIVRQLSSDASMFPSKPNYVPIPERGITSATARKYSALASANKIMFGYTAPEAAEVVAAKIRKDGKAFQTCGEWKSVGLYGQSLFSAGGKFVTLVEGEFDALAAFQMTGSLYPVVSIKNGAGSAMKDCQAQFKWLNSFDNVVISFDMDEPGQAAAKDVAALFAGKSKVMKMAHKDACDYLKAGEAKKFTKDWWAAEAYTPDDIIPSSALYAEVMEELQMPFCSYPWDSLNLMLYGLRFGEIVTVMAGSGVGKSTVVKEVLREVYEGTDTKLGVLSLEETAGVAAMKMMSLSSSKPFHLPTVAQMKTILKDPSRVSDKPFLEDVTAEQRLADKEEAFADVLAADRFMFLQHEGAITMDSVLAQMRYLAKAQDCKVILLDHISILVGLVGNGKTNEREAIDNVMHSLRSLVEETGICLINISHLRKPSDGSGHEEGRRVQLSEARGSGSIAQLSDIAIGLEANRQSDDVEVKNQTVVRVLKNRFSGETGVAGILQYDKGSGRLSEVKEEAL